MKRIGVALTILATGLLFGMGQAVMTDVMAEPVQSETMVYDCRRQTPTATGVVCSCMRGAEQWICNFPIPKGRRGR